MGTEYLAASCGAIYSIMEEHNIIVASSWGQKLMNMCIACG